MNNVDIIRICDHLKKLQTQEDQLLMLAVIAIVQL